jgi:Dehydrogenases with different specificities (related to short-chain alcohol dehydrogenases)
MKVLVTGTTHGIGHSIARLFLEEGHLVVGLDIEPEIDPLSAEFADWKFYQCDVGKPEELPDESDFEIIVNNAATTDEKSAIQTNLLGYVNVGEKYAFQERIKSVVNICSISSVSGIELPNYCISKGGNLAYSQNLSLRLAPRATVNAIICGGVITKINQEILDDEKLYQMCKDETLLGKWCQPREVADLVYYLTVGNKSITGQTITIDNGECAKFNFIGTSEVKNEFYKSQFKRSELYE